MSRYAQMTTEAKEWMHLGQVAGFMPMQSLNGHILLTTRVRLARMVEDHFSRDIRFNETGTKFAVNSRELCQKTEVTSPLLRLYVVMLT